MALNAEQLSTRKKLFFHLEKKELTNIIAQVGFAQDVSNSMKYAYKSGAMQKLNNILYPVAERFDDNKIMDMVAFDHTIHEIPEMTEENYQTYVQDHILSHRNIWGNTEYAPAIQYFVNEWFGSKQVTKVKESLNTGGWFSKFLHGEVKRELIVENVQRKIMPSYLIMQTDGENHDTHETERLIHEIQNKEIYISFLGIGQENFHFIKAMADKYPNVGCFIVENLNKLTDDQLYEGLITDELATCLKNAVVKS